MPPSTTVVKIRNSGPDAQVGIERALDQAEHHPAEPGQPAGQDPDVDADALDVDAGDGRQVAIVGDGAHRFAEARAGQEERDERRHHQRRRRSPPPGPAKGGRTRGRARRTGRCRTRGSAEPATRKMTSRIIRPRPTVMSEMATVPRPRKRRNSPKWATSANRARWPAWRPAAPRPGSGRARR